MAQPLRNTERLSEALQALDQFAMEEKEELKSLLKNRYENLRDVVREIEPEIVGTIKKASDRFGKFARDTKKIGTEEIANMSRKIDTKAHESPWVFIGAASAFGALCGYALGSRYPAWNTHKE